MEVRSRQDAKSVCMKRRHGAMSAGKVLEEESFVCYLKAVALIGLRGHGHFGTCLHFYREKKPAFLPSSTRVELYLPTLLGALTVDPFFFMFANKVKSHRGGYRTQGQTNVSGIRG